MSHGDENPDEDKDSNDENSNKAAAMLQHSSLERHWLQCYLKPPGSLEKKGPPEIMLKQLLGTSTPAYFHTSWSPGLVAVMLPEFEFRRGSNRNSCVS